ncbi:A/G-specific adenine glycosylase [Apiospora kogelbergensis]|uniref:A/G-specific adenine glycosylase n=1 Tax=Apiospora kogelbergensis TaxID=1337665 RepID=UPI00312F4184
MRRSTRSTAPRLSRQDLAPVQGKSPTQPQSRAASKKRVVASESSDEFVNDEVQEKPASKKRKAAGTGGRSRDKNSQLSQQLFSRDGRQHSLTYHRPILLDDAKSRASLLDWFDSVSASRAMPWRKPWIDPSSNSDAAALREQLERRAYEVWISEIMLQQTRVATVIDYWNKWMAKWPTIHDLAAAEADDVLAAWRGLGYYSRATRIHEASKIVCEAEDMQGLLPAEVENLQAHIPGVGRYTAGAISAICFGRPSPMVDGNVLRVLSRQLGLFGDVKTDKAVIDLLWGAATALVEAVAQDAEEPTTGDDGQALSDRPGRWGQGLMELGATICTPKPNCSTCPISSSCRAYSEGMKLATDTNGPSKCKTSKPQAIIPDIEDACTLCQPFEEFALADDVEQKAPEATKAQLSKQTSLQSFFFTSTKGKKAAATSPPDEAACIPTIINHAKKFPIKVVKKAVREEQTLVCAIRHEDGHYLIHRRPEKGLLAGLWEFPSNILPEPSEAQAKSRKQIAIRYAHDVLGLAAGDKRLKHVSELGSVPWLFSHLKLTMHVQLFSVKDIDTENAPVVIGANSGSRWSKNIEGESMGTGMRKCWALVNEAMDISE